MMIIILLCMMIIILLCMIILNFRVIIIGFFLTDVKRTNGSFEAIFNDLSFSRKEILKRARLRLNISREKHCSSKYTLQVIDMESLQTVDEYVRTIKHNGINSIPLTKSLKKWVLGSNGNKGLQVKIIFDRLSTNKSSCQKAASEVSKEAYLITQTKLNEKPILRRPRWRRSAKNLSSQSTSKSQCAIQYINVNLQGGNIMLPHSFSTGLCGAWRSWPSGVVPIRKEVLKAIKRTMKRTSLLHNNVTCCVPTAYKKLFVVYYNSKSHYTLRGLDKIKVTKCGCPSKT